MKPLSSLFTFPPIQTFAAYKIGTLEHQMRKNSIYTQMYSSNSCNIPFLFKLLLSSSAKPSAESEPVLAIILAHNKRQEPCTRELTNTVGNICQYSADKFLNFCLSRAKCRHWVKPKKCYLSSIGLKFFRGSSDR